MRSVTVWFAWLPLLVAALFVGATVAATVGSAQTQPLLVAGKPLAEQLEVCVACHGDGGNATAPNMPSLAGQQPLFITNQLILFREGLRKSELMSPSAQGLKDEEILALADAFAKMPLKPVAVTPDPARIARGGELIKTLRCNNCHLPSLLGREQIPRIAGQREDYLGQSMRQYRDNQRVGSDTSMAAAMYGVPDAEVGALAHFLAVQR